MSKTEKENEKTPNQEKDTTRLLSPKTGILDQSSHPTPSIATELEAEAIRRPHRLG